MSPTSYRSTPLRDAVETLSSGADGHRESGLQCGCSMAARGQRVGAGAGRSRRRSYNFGMVSTNEDSRLNTDERCELCGRAVGVDGLTRHHLLPRSRARKMKRRRKGRQELKLRNPARTVALCNPCHRNVHASIENADLARGYDSVEALRDHPGVRRFTEWVKDKPHGRA